MIELKDEQKHIEFEKKISSFFKENNPNIDSYSEDQLQAIHNQCFNLFSSIEKNWISSKSPTRLFEQQYQAVKHYRDPQSFLKTLFLQHYLGFQPE